LIESRLKPLTTNYFNHLVAEAKRINPLVIPTDIDNYLPEIDETTSPKIKLAYNNINDKFKAVEALKHLLADINTNPLPSKRIELFSQQLKESDQQLKTHNDPTWYHYFKNCMAAIGLICTGIIPGAVALIAYSLLYEKSSPLFFTKSQGAEYTDKAQGLLNQSAIPPLA
jgi:hypothetical protein